ncbi:MAG: glycoside hydrolase family 88 protein [Lachnospiraceae bacterium]|nr:glycoside hydrolase family 88 protein [Lachnospiraceae bacterium]
MERKWVGEVYDKILAKEKKVAQRSRNKIPYTTKDGVFDDRGKTEICWWTNGFWGGMMWQLYHATGEPVYLENALRTEIKLDENLMNRQGMDHDSGFKWLPTAVAHYRVTGDMASRNRALLAADNLASRFNPVGKFIRAWNNWDGNEDGSFAGRAIIDCMMNLPLLYWAGDELYDPRFRHIAKMHADTAIKNFIREDGSAKHIIEFDAETGEYLHSVGGQGYGHGSSWTRGQAWAVYGFMLSYIHTKEERYLATAKKVADYFIANIPDSKLIPVDFRQPQTPAYEDSTAAAIASCGLLELAKCVPDEERATYEDAALEMLKALADKRCNWDENVDNLVEKCTAAYHDADHEFSIIYGDYYFIEAIWKLMGKELIIW